MTLLDQHCVHRAPKLEADHIPALLAEVPGYELDRQRAAISKEYRFSNFYETIAFVNALAYVAHREDHHPDLQVSYSKCRVSFTTHDAGGLTLNDFVCAARVDALAEPGRAGS